MIVSAQAFGTRTEGVGSRGGGGGETVSVYNVDTDAS